MAEEIERVLGIPADEILRISAKTGEGVPELLDAVVERIPPPTGDADAPLQALIFDSYYDPYRGVVSVGARVQRHARSRAIGSAICRRATTHDAEEIGVRLPVPTPVASLGPGRGRLPHRRDQGRRRGAGRRDGHDAVDARRARSRATATRSRWCSAGCIPVVGDEYADLREALERLRLNDSSFTYEPETSGALGFGFRCGFLGLLHMEIVRERLEREYDLSLVATAPNVEYHVHLADGGVEVVDNPSAMPPREHGRVHRGAVRHGDDPHARPTTSARSWSSARSGGAR